ncbi:YlxR family protein [Actinomycetospora sp. TBRC 11914]|uniref:YlxR family protein n=1 Tax=Actinomycetospora sp. TBRC 11914 TaxID=2729387 RepID=UPI00145CD48C|nr:YlxR family protein [Actinomycetospora sp. TBRC 11914]NMO89941.1 YlxR family protein [Actinomycetospora sp. TBRC 11914]
MARNRPAPREEASIEGPVRTCVGCRSRGPVSELLRVVAVDGACEPDPRRRKPGRGAWVHPATECLHRAERRSAFPRALRVPGPLDTGALRALLGADPVPDSRVEAPTPVGAGGRGSRSTPDEPAVKHSR